MSGRVFVVGSINVDLVVRGVRLPSPGETTTGGVFERHHGGKGANQAVAAARLGATTAFIGAVGGDRFGEEARSALVEAGVASAGLVTIAERGDRSRPHPRRRCGREPHRRRLGSQRPV